VAQADEIRPSYINPDAVTGAAIFQSGITRDVGPTLGANIDAIDQMGLNTVGGLSELAAPWYSDQILPFDITLAASNEYGSMAGAKILGVEILNEGTGVSIDDTVTETQATFVARRIKTAQTRWETRFPLAATFSIRSRSPPRAGGQPLPDQLFVYTCRLTHHVGESSSYAGHYTRIFACTGYCATAQDGEKESALLSASRYRRRLSPLSASIPRDL
jgi:hypothetical protein